ncbi:digeranylgeranylglyceryl phosphate synthase [Scenedesmus sp. PABB004]|nr:digeranylgeranylglyceryl phosphate synthase [Scenedesmus sp. PABB004]
MRQAATGSRPAVGRAVVVPALRAPGRAARVSRRRPVAALSGAAAGDAGGGASGEPAHAWRSERLAPYLALARIHNVLPSAVLVAVGAWAGSGHRVAAVQSGSVVAMAAISGAMAVASVVVNDYFDRAIDATNAPHKPLPSGAVAPDAALLLSSCLYCGCLIAACLLEPSGLRCIVAFSAAATLLYTPLFKRLTAIKNATVATVIALAPLAGALAAGAGAAGIARLAPAALYAFGGVMFREILMDLNDAPGDRAAGVWTLPVLLGKPAALAAAAGFLAAGAAAAGGALLRAGAPAPPAGFRPPRRSRGPAAPQRHQCRRGGARGMSTSCHGLMAKYVDCLRQTACFKEGGKTVTQCAERLPEECNSLRYALFACKRGQMDARTRIQGNKGY